jgi:solute carrier family 25 2-oxodicarboxylate transporter 21
LSFGEVQADSAVGANGYWSGVLTSNGTRQNTQALALATGFLAGGTESVVVTPFELVKIRLQDKSTNFAGPIDVIKHAIKTEGVGSLYKGMEATFWR